MNVPHDGSRRLRRDCQLGQRGQSLVEFAMVLPLLLLIVFGITEFGRAYYQYNTLSKAVRNGARYMSSHTYSSANITNAQNMVVYGNTAGTGTPVVPGLTAATVVVTPTGGSGPYNEVNTPLSVTIGINSYPFNALVPSVIALNVT